MDLPFGLFRLGSLVCDLWFGIFGLRSLVWDLSLGSLVWDGSIGVFSLVSFVRGLLFRIL